MEDCSSTRRSTSSLIHYTSYYLRFVRYVTLTIIFHNALYNLTKVDFRGSDFKEAANLQIHWETPEDAGINYGYDINQKPNSRVYNIVEIIDKTRLRIYPEYQNSGPIENDNTASYSIFRPNPWFLVFRIIIEDIIE